MNADSDQAFLSLLSSQRELLNRLNMDTAWGPDSSKSTNKEPSSSPVVNLPHRHHHHHSSLNTPCTNQSIAERRSSLDFITSKRFSMGFGCDPIAFSSGLVPSSWKDDDMDFFGEKRCKEEPFGKEESKRRKKRRMSSLGFLSPMFFEDNLKPYRRDSITFGPDENDPIDMGDQVEQDAEASIAGTEPLKVESTGEKDKVQGKVEEKKEEGDKKTKLEGQESKEDEKNGEDEDAKDNDDEEEDDDDDDDSSTGSISVDPIEYKPPIQVDPAKVKETMEAFHKAMEMTQNSQQAIHDWDRKMGLKRSHSKTMRLSSRSRKKLKAIMKKEINNMSVKC